MCLITKQDKPSIAEQDLTVYKLLSTDDDALYAQSIFRNFKYEIGKLYETEMVDIQITATFDVRASEHISTVCAEWNTFSSAYHKLIVMKKNGIKSIGPGYHACITIERLAHHNLKYRYSIYQCTIPKGSEYYEDGDDLIVSNQIIINKIHVPNN